jgi:DNA-binding beta-propeller fold protein YncE
MPLAAPVGRRVYVTVRNSNAVEVFDTAKLVSDPDYSRLGKSEGWLDSSRMVGYPEATQMNALSPTHRLPTTTAPATPMIFRGRFTAHYH